MIIFHSLILLISSKRPIDLKDRAIYKKEYKEFVKTQFYHKDLDFDSLSEGEQKEDELSLQRRLLVKDMEIQLLLPPFFSLDLLFKYKLYDNACQLLFYKEEYEALLQLIRFEYEIAK